MGHETSVRQARDVDAAMVDPTELTDPSNDGPQETRVIDVLRIRCPAAAVGVPRVAYSLGPDHDKPNLIRLLTEAGQIRLLTAGSSKAVQVQAEGNGETSVIARRHMDQECTVTAANRHAHRCFSGNQSARAVGFCRRPSP